jgi:glycosyltransferase involved in cell wall biosynthesis
MRVVHVHRIGGIGGSERHLLTLLPALAERGVDVSFLGLDDLRRAPDPFYAALDAAGIGYARLPSTRNADPRVLRRVSRELRRLRPDLVHTHLVHADVYGGLAARAPIVSTKHNDDPFRAGPFRLVERGLTRRARHVICITEALARFNRERVGLPAEKLSVVHYGLDAPPEAWAADEGPGPAEGRRVLLAVCRLEPQKGLDVAVRALPEILAAEPGAMLVALGEGPQRAELESLARSLGVADAVYLPGRVGDVAAWLERAALLLHPAHWEGFGLALLEAMLVRRAVVATRVSSIPEIVADGETGIVVEPGRPDEIALAATRLLADEELRRRLGEAGYTRARREFSVARMSERTLDVYARSSAAR